MYFRCGRNQILGALIWSYYPHVSSHTSPLQGLLKKDTALKQQEAFDKLMKEVISALALNHFYIYLPTSLVTNASRLHELGFVLPERTKNNQTKISQWGEELLYTRARA